MYCIVDPWCWMTCHDLPTSSTDSTWNTLWAGHQQGIMMNDQSMATRTPARKPVDMITYPITGFYDTFPGGARFLPSTVYHQAKQCTIFFEKSIKFTLHLYCLIPPKTGDSMTPYYFKSPEKNPTVPNTRLASFSIEKSFHVGICFHLNSLLCQNPTWWDVCKQYECYCCRNQNQYRLNKSSKGLLRSCFLSLRFWALFGTAKWCVPSPPAVENC